MYMAKSKSRSSDPVNATLIVVLVVGIVAGFFGGFVGVVQFQVCHEAGQDAVFFGSEIAFGFILEHPEEIDRDLGGIDRRHPGRRLSALRQRMGVELSRSALGGDWNGVETVEGWRLSVEEKVLGAAQGPLDPHAND